MKKIPIGISDFKEIIENKYHYIDKTLFINEISKDGSKVILLPRPRRFGKTLNMNMLKCFYERGIEGSASLFQGLKISAFKDVMALQGTYPVIYLTFKDMKDSYFEKLYYKITEILSQEYGKHEFLLTSDCLNESEKKYFKRILHSDGTQGEYETSLKNLSKFLSRYYGKKVMILVDEYDVPIESGYLYGYYEQSIEFIRNFLSGGLKDNEHLEKAVLTGILRIGKESIFSGLNNLKVCTILEDMYGEYFGFSEREVKDTLREYGVDFEMDEISKWYNGYVFGNQTIYNPWSILNYIDQHSSGFRPYWVNTSSNDLVKLTLTQGSVSIKQDLEDLILGNVLIKQVNEDIVMNEIMKDSENVWSFLLFSGYLKAVKKERKEGILFCNLTIPNLEVVYLYKQIILSWFKENISNENFSLMLKSLVIGDIKTFSKIFKTFMQSSISYFDTAGKDSERVYHSFVLGMLIALNENYEVKSNRESGYGRYDVMIIPKDVKKLGIIIEFKKVDKDDQEDLSSAVEEALRQIKDKKYKTELIDRGIENILEIGMAFQGKDVLIKSASY